MPSPSPSPSIPLLRSLLLTLTLLTACAQDPAPAEKADHAGHASPTVAAATLADQGLSGTYYADLNFAGGTNTRVDGPLNFNWQRTEPFPNYGDSWSARWTGFLQAPASGRYTLVTTSDDGVRLWLDNTPAPLINDWTSHAAKEIRANVNLTAGARVPVKLEYFDGGGNASLKLEWIRPDGVRELIPASVLSTSNTTPSPTPTPTPTPSPTPTPTPLSSPSGSPIFSASVPARALAPWPVFRRVDALATATDGRVGLSTVWGSYWERSEDPYGIQGAQQTQELGGPTDGNFAAYDVDFGTGVDSLLMRVSVPSGTSAVEARLGSATGPVVASCALATTGNEVYKTVNCALNAAGLEQAKGPQKVVFRFTAGTNVRFNWFAFWAKGTMQNIDRLQKIQSTGMANRAAPSLPLAGTAARAQSLLPAPGDVPGRSFGKWAPSLVGECPKWLHDTYWVRGDDTKVYPTWHPPVDYNPETGMYCSYGHEHGDDPRGSEIFGVAKMPPFGYVGELHATMDASLHRDEDHVGHKVRVGNNWQMYAADGGGTKSCDVVVKLHMGTHSPDALVNTMHEMFVAGQCEGLQPFDVKQFALFGAPGSFKEAEAYLCNRGVTPALAPNPANQPIGGVHRAIPTVDCFLRGTGDEQRSSVAQRTTEFWLTGLAGGSFYFSVNNPGRVYDPTSATKIKRTMELCFTATNPLAATLPCTETVAASPTPVAWNDPRSAFRGAVQIGTHFSALAFGPSAATVVYTDAFGRQARATPDPTRDITVKQLVPTTGFHYKVDGHASLFPYVDYSAGGQNGVHAPN